MLAFAAPVLERVAFEGHLGGSVCGGQFVAIACKGGVEDEVRVAVLVLLLLIGIPILVGFEVNDLLIVIDHALDVRMAVDCLL